MANNPFDGVVSQTGLPFFRNSAASTYGAAPSSVLIPWSGLASAAAGGVLSGIGSLISGNQAAKAQREANATNLRIAQETNAQNYALAQQNMSYNQQMYERQNSDAIKFWQMQNAYNDPSKEIERLRAAGLNPLMMYGNGQPAGSISAATAPQNNVDGTAQIGEPVQPVYGSNAASAISDAMAKTLQLWNGVSQARIASTDAEYRQVQILEMLNKLRADTHKTGQESKVLDDTLDVLKATKEHRIMQSELTTASMKQSIKNMQESVISMQADRRFKQLDIDLKTRIADFNDKKFEEDLNQFKENMKLAWFNANTQRMEAGNSANSLKLAEKQFEFNKQHSMRLFKMQLKRDGMSASHIREVEKLAREQFEYEKLSPVKKFFSAVGSHLMGPYSSFAEQFGNGATSSW